MSLEDHKRRERAQAVGLFRYQLICAALDAELSTKQRGKLVRAIAAEAHTDPFGNTARISRETLDRWTAGYGATGLAGSRPWCPARGCCRRAPTRPCWNWRPRSSGRTQTGR